MPMKYKDTLKNENQTIEHYSKKNNEGVEKKNDR